LSFLPEKPPEKAPNQISRPALAAGAVVLMFIFTGTIVYHSLERSWTWIDSFYFSVVTLTTVGYGDLTPTSQFSRLFTSIYLLLGTGVVVAALGIIGSRYLEMRGQRMARRRQNKNQDDES
jgi:voltage-gated potassium channel